MKAASDAVRDFLREPQLPRMAQRTFRLDLGYAVLDAISGGIISIMPVVTIKEMESAEGGRRAKKDYKNSDSPKYPCKRESRDSKQPPQSADRTSHNPPSAHTIMIRANKAQNPRTRVAQSHRLVYHR